MLSTATLGLFVEVLHLGLGKHAEAFPLENIFPFFKIMYFYSILIISAYSFIKLSIGFFLLRLADRTKWRPFLIGMLGKYQQLEIKIPETDSDVSFHCCLHPWLHIPYHLSVYPCTSRMGLRI